MNSAQGSSRLADPAQHAPCQIRWAMNEVSGTPAQDAPCRIRWAMNEVPGTSGAVCAWREPSSAQRCDAFICYSVMSVVFNLVVAACPNVCFL